MNTDHLDLNLRLSIFDYLRFVFNLTISLFICIVKLQLLIYNEKLSIRLLLCQIRKVLINSFIYFPDTIEINKINHNVPLYHTLPISLLKGTVGPVLALLFARRFVSMIPQRCVQIRPCQRRLIIKVCQGLTNLLV